VLKEVIKTIFYPIKEYEKQGI